MENGIVSEEKKKISFDEQTLGKLLEAAFVLQEHNREVRELELGLDLKRDQIEAQEKAEEQSRNATAPAAPKNTASSSTSQDDYTSTLAQIVSTQHQIQIRHLELDKAMSLVAERVIEIAHASGAAVGIVDGKKVRYRAASGSKTLPVGTEVPIDRALCQPCVRNAQVFRCPDINPEFLIDTEECRRRGIQSLIAVPIFHEGGAAGGLELYYPTPHAFTEQDVHTCQLMAGLVTEALAREEEQSWKQSLANERAVMIEALEKLKPNLAALVDPAKEHSAAGAAPAPEIAPYTCATCGHKLVAGEQFCGQCGTARAAAKPKAAPFWPLEPEKTNETPLAKATAAELAPATNTHTESADSPHDPLADLFSPVRAVPEPSHDLEDLASADSELEVSAKATEPRASSDFAANEEITTDTESEPEEEASDQKALAKLTHPADWSSAASAREFLEQLATGKQSALRRFWDTRRGDIYLAVAVILVLCVVRFGIWSNHPTAATAAPPAGAQEQIKPAADANLSVFDRMLISLGLADAPQTPEDKGNPSIQVWVDLHTALYYCPGTDLYGKTLKGKYESQRDAQLDQFQPASRKPCE